MHNTLAVRCVQTSCNLRGDAARLLQRQHVLTDEISKRAACQQLHREKNLDARRPLMCAEIMYSTHVRVRDSLCELDLILETREHAGIPSQIRPDRFKGDEPAQLCVLGLVDVSHPARGKKAKDAKTSGEHFACSEQRFSGPRSDTGQKLGRGYRLL